MSGHAEISPSGMARIVTCPASVQASLKVDPREDDEWNIEGTDAHNKLYDWLYLGVPPKDGILYEHLEQAFDLVREYEDKGYTLYFEKMVRYSDRIWGTADIIAIKGKRIVIIDYKHGYRLVEVERNAQLNTYGMCSIVEFGVQFTEFEFIIVQPRQPHRDGPVRRVVADADLIEWHRVTVEHAVKEADSYNPEFVPSKHCKFCPLEGCCIAYANWIAEMATGEKLL